MASPCRQIHVNIVQADDIDLQLMSRHAGVAFKPHTNSDGCASLCLLTIIGSHLQDYIATVLTF